MNVDNYQVRTGCYAGTKVQASPSSRALLTPYLFRVPDCRLYISKVWTGEVSDPEQAEDEAVPRTVSLSWGEECSVEVSQLKFTSYSHGSTPFCKLQGSTCEEPEKQMYLSHEPLGLCCRAGWLVLP